MSDSTKVSVLTLLVIVLSTSTMYRMTQQTNEIEQLEQECKREFK